MKLDFKLLADRLRQPLPGADAHEPLRAVPMGSIKPNFEHKTPTETGQRFNFIIS